MANINFFPPIFIHYHEEKLKEYIKSSPKAKRSDLLSNFLNLFFMETYGDQSGELWILELK